MPIITPDEGYRAPTDTDLAAVPADMLTLAKAIDGQGAEWLADFIAGIGLPGFMVTCTTNNAGLTSGQTSLCTFQSITYSSGGSQFSGFGGTNWWDQPAGDGAAWWLLGCNLTFTNVSGSFVANTYFGAGMNVTDFDPATQQGTSSAVWGSTVETGTSGNESINMAAPFRFLGDGEASISWGHNDTGSGATKCLGVGSTFWGIRLGDG